jgi:hypothetical protein
VNQGKPILYFGQSYAKMENIEEFSIENSNKTLGLPTYVASLNIEFAAIIQKPICPMPKKES